MSWLDDDRMLRREALARFEEDRRRKLERTDRMKLGISLVCFAMCLAIACEVLL